MAAAAVIVTSQRTNERSIRALSTRYMEEVAVRAQASVEEYLAVVPRCMELVQSRLAESRLAESRLLESRQQQGTEPGARARLNEDLERLYRRLLTVYDEVDAFGWGEPNGNFMMVRRMADGTLSSKWMRRVGDQVESRWRHDNPAWADEDGYDDRLEPADEAYDPRRRDWYVQAVEAEALIWSDPYIFYSGRRPGISSGFPLYEDGRLLGVVASDLRIDKLSNLLHVARRGAGRVDHPRVDHRRVDHRRVAILTPEGGIIAHSGLAAEGVSLSRQVAEQGDWKLILRRLSQSPDQVMARAFDQLRQLQAESGSPFTFSYAGAAWVARFDIFPVHPKRSWVVCVLDRENRLLGSLRHHHQMTLGVALLCLVSAIGLATLVPARAQRERLAREKQKIDQEREVNRQLRDLDRIKNEFLANTSHELRTPLFGIAGLAQALASREKRLPEQSRKDLELIVSSCGRLTALVNDVLDFSKLRKHELSLEVAAAEVRSIVDVVTTLSAPLIGSKDLELINAVPAYLPPVYADRGRIEQVLHNLVGNAVGFTESGFVEIGAEVRGDAVEIWVKDTGPGVSAADRERIFKSFEQGAAAERRQGGTGLGLAVSRQLVELHGGRLWLDSEEGEGATFRFTLPVWGDGEHDPYADGVFAEPSGVMSLLPLKPESSTSVTSPFQAAPSSEAAGERMPVATVLIVDDEPVNLRVLSSYLAPEPYRVLQASSGAEALERLEAEAVDVVLLDVMMPNMSGFEVCRRLRRRWSIEDLSVLFLTARAQVGDRVAGFAEGANDYLIKPVERSELLSRIAKELQLLHRHRDLLEEARTLSGMLPMCPTCKRIRDDEGFWETVEGYVGERTGAQFSHGICPQCIVELYGEIPGLDLSRLGPSSPQTPS